MSVQAKRRKSTACVNVDGSQAPDELLPFVVTAIVRGRRMVVGRADEKGVKRLLRVCDSLGLSSPIVRRERRRFRG